MNFQQALTELQSRDTFSGIQCVLWSNHVCKRVLAYTGIDGMKKTYMSSFFIDPVQKHALHSWAVLFPMASELESEWIVIEDLRAYYLEQTHSNELWPFLPEFDFQILLFNYNRPYEKKDQARFVFDYNKVLTEPLPSEAFDYLFV